MKEEGKIILPALRGVMGDWVFYSCLMDIREISERVQYADEVHKSKSLSDMIQRRLVRSRSEQIATYLRVQKERFFNSLVIATYGGKPRWRALKDIRDLAAKADLKNLDEETVESVGFLIFNGDEELFAIDGQHRLAGIKRAVKEGWVKDPYDTLSVIFVGHHVVKRPERTRRLFTTLNKTARPVSKGDIIALDEDDVMAICVRWLIEKITLFGGGRIALVAKNNIPPNNLTSLTTIGNLYDLLTIIFTKTHFDLRKDKPKLRNERPSDEALEAYFKYAEYFFNLLEKHFFELEEFFASENTEAIVLKYRRDPGANGGNALFRPIGLDVFTQIIARLNSVHSLEEAVVLAAKLPRKLSEPPFAGLMWNTSTERIVNDYRLTLREVLLYMLGHPTKFSDEILTERYRKEIGDENASLPDRVV